MFYLTKKQNRAKKRGLIFFTSLFLIVLFSQLYCFIHGEEVHIYMIIAGGFLIIFCQFYFELQMFLEKKKWI